MFKIRTEQMEVLRKARVENFRATLIQDYRTRGLAANKDPETGDILIEDAAGGAARMSVSQGGISVTLGEDRTFHAEHNSQGWLTALTDPAGVRIGFEHDQHGHLVALHRGQHSSYRLEFDDQDRLAAIIFPDGWATRLEHDQASRLSLVTDRNGQSTCYEYSDAGLLTGTTAPGGNETRFEYDETGGFSSIVFVDGSRHDFEFDADDYLRKMFVNGKEHATFHWDEQTGTNHVDYADGTKAYFVLSNGRIVEAANETCTVRLEYDEQGRLIREETNGQIVVYRRNAIGALIGIITPDGEQLSFARDREHNVRQIIDWSGGQYEIGYAPVGSLAEIRYPNGSSMSLTATAMGLVESLQILSPVSPRPVVLHRWEYDNCDRVTQMTDGMMARQYHYDGEGRLLEVASSNLRLAERFELDANGNRLRDETAVYEINSLNRLTRCGAHTFSYDERGNLTSGPLHAGQARFIYNGRDQLITVATPVGKTHYAYDAFGRRVRKECAEQVTCYVWAGQQLLGEITRDGKKTTRRDYLMYPERPFPLAMRVDGEIFYLYPGRLGEPLSATNGRGEVVWQADYSAFGQARIVIEQVSQPFRLAGQYFDDETGLYYTLARYYNPELGRYLTMDPLRVDGGSLNFYTYCDGDPINRYDPTGAFVIPAILVAVAIGAVIGAAINAGVEMYRQYKTKGKIDDGLAIAKEAGIGAVVGAVGGAIGFAGGGAGVAIAGLVGGAASAAEYCTEQTLRGEEITAGGFVGNFLLGGAIGAVTAGVGGILAARTARKAQRAAKAIQEAERRAAQEAQRQAAEEAARDAAQKAARQKRLAELSIDPQTKRVLPKSAEEAGAILEAEEKGIVKNARRPDLEKGEPNLDFKVDGGYADVKTPRPHSTNPLSEQAKGIASKSKLYDDDVKVIVNLQRLDTAQKAQFKADLAKEGADMSKISFVGD